MLETAAEGTGSCGIVVQGPRGDIRSQTKRIGKCYQGGRTSRNALYARVSLYPRTPRVAQFDSAVQIAGVLLRRLNIAPRPIAGALSEHGLLASLVGSFDG